MSTANQIKGHPPNNTDTKADVPTFRKQPLARRRNNG